MDRVAEPELMDDAGQALAYARADFAEPHERFVDLFAERFPAFGGDRQVLDLGCGPADICLRFARRYPDCRIDGVDGAEAMLALGRAAVAQGGLSDRLQLIQGYLPGAVLPREHYEAVISNSLLHHLNQPMALWQTIAAHAAPGAPVFVMDLMRPATRSDAEALVARYAAGEPEVLRHDFFHSLLAAYRPDEVAEQLASAGLPLQVEAVSDRHLIVFGVHDAV